MCYLEPTQTSLYPTLSNLLPSTAHSISSPLEDYQSTLGPAACLQTSWQPPNWSLNEWRPWALCGDHRAPGHHHCIWCQKPPDIGILVEITDVSMRLLFLGQKLQRINNIHTSAARSTHILEYDVRFTWVSLSFGKRVKPEDCDA